MRSIAHNRGFIATVMLLLGAFLLAACGSAQPTATTAAQSAATAPATATIAAPAATAPATSAASSASAATAPATAAAPSATSPTGAAPASASPGTKMAMPIAPGAQRFAIVPADSKATYHVNETLVGKGFNTAVGSTDTIAGDIYIDRANPSASSIGPITVDLSKLTSDQSRRDNTIRSRFLESSKYPTATFVAKRLEGLPTTPYTDGQTLTFKIVGDLTVRTVTKEVTFDATGKIVGGTFTSTAHTTFNMTDFGFDSPDIAGLVKAENGVVLDLAITAKKAS